MWTLAVSVIDSAACLICVVPVGLSPFFSFHSSLGFDESDEGGRSLRL